jgi:hypothetical protein
VAPRVDEPEEPVPAQLFGEAAKQAAAARLANLRAAKAAKAGEASADPLESLRRAAQDASEAEHDTGVADPFHLGRDDRNEADD